MAKSLRSPEHLALLAVITGARRAAGLDQREVASRLRWSQPKYSNVESGVRRLDVVEFRRLAAALGVNDVWLYAQFAEWAEARGAKPSPTKSPTTSVMERGAATKEKPRK